MAFKMKGYSAFDRVEDKPEYKVPSPEQQATLTEEYRAKTGKDHRYDPALSRQDGAHRFS
jgi:hypothetical protein